MCTYFYQDDLCKVVYRMKKWNLQDKTWASILFSASALALRTSVKLDTSFGNTQDWNWGNCSASKSARGAITFIYVTCIYRKKKKNPLKTTADFNFNSAVRTFATRKLIQAKIHKLHQWLTLIFNPKQFTIQNLFMPLQTKFYKTKIQ